MFDLTRIAAATDGFSGAELEGIVVAAMYAAYASAAAELTTDDVVREAHATVPLSRARAEDVQRVRAWANGRAVPASSVRTVP